MKLSKHFSKEEFDCNDGSEMPTNVLQNIEDLVDELEIIRKFFNKSITINSGYRSESYNKSIGGASKSQHLLGNAADIVIEGVEPDIVADAIEGLNRIGVIKIGGLGRYDTFTHVDIREDEARWDNRK